MVLVLESAAIEIEDGVRDFPVSPEISISLAIVIACFESCFPQICYMDAQRIRQARQIFY